LSLPSKTTLKFGGMLAIVEGTHDVANNTGHKKFPVVGYSKTSEEMETE
jgi:hypothetical protein